MKGDAEVVRCGYLKKLKTCRRKFFVLRAETVEASARLEYYDSERKCSAGQPPKRSIPLKSCFNINRRLDTKHKHVIALYTKDDCFCVVLDNDEEADAWLKALLKLQHGEEVVDGEAPKPTFEHVWQVTVCNRGLGNAGLTGNYRLCLTDKTLSLIKKDCELPQIELNLTNLRSCGNLRDFFFLEIGRSSTLGAGELWMQTEDNNIAHNVHSTVFHAMSSTKEDLTPKIRIRSSSATESSKPNYMSRKIHNSVVPPPKCHILPQGSDTRERSGSMPSRARSTSEGTHSWNHQTRHLNPHRPISLYARDISHSPPTGSPVSPPSVGCSTDSAGSSYSLTDDTDICAEMDQVVRYGHSLTPDEAIAEEDCPDSPPYGATYISRSGGPQSSDDGYVDMFPRGRHHNHSSPTASISSVTSGTPSTDMRFAEYPLEKVTSYLTSEDDDTRPMRANSVGSKPEGYKKYTEMYGAGDSLRVRALSVGSKTKKVPARVLPPSSFHVHQGTKSSSAPILTTSRVQGSHNSIGPMDDLMELDFSGSGTVNSSGYMKMRPGSKNHHGYVEMKPGRVPTETSPYVDMSQGSSPAKVSYISSPPHTGMMTTLPLDLPSSGNYMEMDPRKNIINNNNINNNNNSDYLTMSFKSPNYQVSPVRSSPLGIYLGSPRTEPATPEGYMEMSIGRGHQRQSSLDSQDDYANMSVGKKRDRKKTRSQPIAIQNPGGNPPKIAAAGSSSPRYALIGRKYSTGTPPMNLPLTNETTPYASLPRQQRRRDSSSSSSVVTTPSSSSTIFPFTLNSPCSPPTKKSDDGDYTPMDFDSAPNQSDYVNFGGRGIVRTPNDDYAIMKPTTIGARVTSPSTRLSMIHLSDSAAFRPINETADYNNEDTRAYDLLRTDPTTGRSSASSDLCSSGSTIVGSRPESVNSDRIRPASVTSADVQLHYASLDLDEGRRSPHNKEGASGASSSSGTTEVTLTYAAIDFVKSEGLRSNSMAASNTKVKH